MGPTGTAAAGEHSSVIDARFVWWDPNKTSPVNGMKGSYVAIDNGKRWRLGQWPKTLPAALHEHVTGGSCS